MILNFINITLKKKYLEIVALLLRFFFIRKYSIGLSFFLGCSLDKLRFIFLLLLFWIFIILLIISVKYGSFNLLKYKLFLIVLLICLFISVRIENMFGFYIFFELSLIPLFFIIVGWGYQRERIQAAFYLFLYTVVGSLPILFVFILIHLTNNSCWLMFMFQSQTAQNSLLVCLVAILVGFLIKLPIYGIHLWLPKAHVEAPVAGSIVLAAVLLKFRLYGLLRVLYFFKGTRLIFFMIFLLWGGVLRSFLAIRQRDIKSLAAYSSIGHMASIMASCFLFFCRSVWAAVIIMVAHGFCSSALFYIINNLYEQNKSRQTLVYRGQVFVFFIGVWWALFLAINFATPPFIGLLGEILIISIIRRVRLAYSFLVVLSSFSAAVFRFYLFRAVVHGKSSKSFRTVASYDFFNIVCLFHIFPAILFSVKMRLLWF